MKWSIPWTRSIERMAPQYDTEERYRVAGIIAGEIRAHITGGKEKDALDYGCGTGLVGLLLAEEFRSLLLVDTSPRMVAQVDRKLAGMDIPTVKTLCCDFCEALPSLGVDIVFLAQVLLHIGDTRLILERLFALLRPGGQLIIVDFDKDEGIASDKVHNGFVQSELIAMAKQAGFSDAEAHTFYRGEKLFMNRDGSMFLLRGVKPAASPYPAGEERNTEVK